MKKKVLLKAPCYTTSGYGHHARTVLRALRAYEEFFDIYVEGIEWGRCGWLPFNFGNEEENTYFKQLSQKTEDYIGKNKGNPLFDIFLHITIPNEWENKASTNIGITAGIETNKISAQWIEKSQIMDKIIVVSNHAKYGFNNSTCDARDNKTGEIVKDFFRCGKQIDVLGYPVRKFPSSQLDIQLETDFNFLLIAQWSVRKNVEQAITWFIQENFNNENVGLVCKLNTSSNCYTDKVYTEKRLKALLYQYSQKKCKVYLIHGDMDENDMASLYTDDKIKAAISISPEGFGLFPFEAAYYGMPVVTFGWGGPVDFMYMDKKSNKGKLHKKAMFAEVDYELKPIPKEAVWPGVLEADSMWAYPKEGSFKTKIREVRGNYSKFKEMAIELQAHLEKTYSEEIVYHQYAEAILGRKIVKVDKSMLPTVSIITSVFKSKNYLKNCLEDISRQTLFPEKCELILVHPKSSPEYEDEKEIIEKFMEDNPSNVKLVELENDPGLYGCWNEGVRNSTGEYITNWNTDDRRNINCLEICSKELLVDEELKIVYFDQLITDKPNETFENNSSNGKKYNFPEYSFDYMKMMNLIHAMPLWKKELHDKYGMFSERFKSASDWEFFLRCCYEQIKVKKLSPILGLYYFNPEGISTNVDNFDSKRKEEEEVYETYKDLQVGDGKLSIEKLRELFEVNNQSVEKEK